MRASCIRGPDVGTDAGYSDAGCVRLECGLQPRLGEEGGDSRGNLARAAYERESEAASARDDDGHARVLRVSVSVQDVVRPRWAVRRPHVVQYRQYDVQVYRVTNFRSRSLVLELEEHRDDQVG